jgi:hypothetical protein
MMSMSMTELEQALRALRLSGMIATLQARALQVAHHQMDFTEAFASLVQDELDRLRIPRDREQVFHGMVNSKSTAT